MKEQSRGIIIHNPAAGSNEKRGIVEKAAANLQKGGWNIDVAVTEEPGHAFELSKKARMKRMDVVFAAGGDGTLNEVMQPLVNSDTALAFLPTGSINMWAKDTHTPLEVPAAAHALAKGKFRTIDVGKINDTYFLTVAGAGFDGKVIQDYQKPGERKKGKGHAIYLASTMKNLATHMNSSAARIGIDGEEIDIKLFQGWFSNTQTLAYTTLRPESFCDDAKLEATFFKGSAVPGVSKVIGGVSLGLGIASAKFSHGIEPPFALYRQGEKFSIETTKPIYFQVDGEPLTKTKEANIEVFPSSLRVLVPNKESEIFSRK